MPQSSWLFIKDGQSIWEERSFPNEDSLQAFQMSLGKRLTSSGWFLWGFDRERRETTERRGVARPGGDRRAARR